jgi:hypothetical protein
VVFQRGVMPRIRFAGFRPPPAIAVALCVVLTAFAPSRAQPPSAPVTVADGTWTVQGREIPGTRCGRWLVRLTSRDGRLSGVVSLARASLPIQDLALRPDGSFSGSTRAGAVGSTVARPYTVTGRFSGDAVHLTLETYRCPPRRGSAMRRAAPG